VEALSGDPRGTGVRSILDTAYGLPRTPLLRGWVNKAKKKAGVATLQPSFEVLLVLLCPPVDLLAVLRNPVIPHLAVDGVLTRAAVDSVHLLVRVAALDVIVARTAA
jgi:hypothetical protein